MISDFQPREFGFVFAWGDLSDDDLKIMNYFISDKSYMEKDAAKILQNGIAQKKYLSREENIFVVLFEYVSYDNKQGYWIYGRLVLQMKDCLDCLNFLYPYFYFVFLF